MARRTVACFIYTLLAVLSWSCVAQAQQGSITLSGSFNAKVYNRSYNPQRYVTQGRFKVTVVITKWSVYNGSIFVNEGEMWINGPVSAHYSKLSGGVLSPRNGGYITTRQTTWRGGFVNQFHISFNNYSTALNITGKSGSFNQYVFN